MEPDIRLDIRGVDLETHGLSVHHDEVVGPNTGKRPGVPGDLHVARTDVRGGEFLQERVVANSLFRAQIQLVQDDDAEMPAPAQEVDRSVEPSPVPRTP